MRTRTIIKQFDENPGFKLPEDANPHDVSAVMIRWFAGIKDERGKASGIWADGEYSIKPGYRALRRLKRKTDADWTLLCSDEGPAWVREAISHLSADHVAVWREVSQLLVEASKPENTAHNKMTENKFALCLLPAMMEILELMVLHYDAVFQ